MSVPETPNLHLKKPEYTDPADVFDMNDNMDILDQAIPDIWKKIYPVGAIFMSVNNTSPATLFGGGTWVQIKDCFLLSAGDNHTAGGTGGAETKSYTPAGTVGSHTLTTSEIPSHGHSLNSHTHSVGAHSHGLNSHTHSIPAHTHDAMYNPDRGFATFSLTDTGTGVGFQPGGTYYAGYSVTTKSGGGGTTGAASGNTANSSAFNSGAASGNTGNAGGGGGHNHGFTGTAANINVMPPYLTVYMWKRTA